MSSQPLFYPNSGVFLPRPHYRLEGDALYFLKSTQPIRRLSVLEREAWQAMQREEAQGGLLAPAAADTLMQALLGLWRDGLCERAERKFAAGRRRILVVEPHADDAALSMGGLMWQRRHEHDYIIATMASRSNYTFYQDLGQECFEVDWATSLRGAESQLFCRMIGATHIDVGMTDAALRYHDADWSLDFFMRHRLSIAAVTRRWPDQREWQRWTEAARSLLEDTRSDEIWLPLGSPHVDHRITASIFLPLLVADAALLDGRVLRFYQDVPYAARYPRFTGDMLALLANAGVALEQEKVPIDATLEQKLRLVSIYASQFEVASMRQQVLACARQQDGHHVEFLWRAVSLPSHIDPLMIASAKHDELVQQRSGLAWIGRNREAPCVRVLLLAPTGRWTADLATLCAVFPRADFDVIASEVCEAEVAAVPCARARVAILARGPRGLGQLALGLAAVPPLPTLLHVNEGELRRAQWLSRLCLTGEVFISSSMNWLSHADQGLDHGHARRAVLSPDTERRQGERLRVLVVIVNYRTLDLTLACLRSIAPQAAEDAALRVALVDNDSGDGPALAAAIRERGWESWISLTIAERNGGFSYGNNLAIAAALKSPHPPDYFLLLNPDTEVRKGAIRELVKYMDMHPEAGIAGSCFERADGTPWPLGFRFPTIWSQFEEGIRFGPVSRLLRKWLVAMTMGNEPAEVDWVSGASMMVRRALIDDIGLMDEGYFLYFEEVDFCLRASRAGWYCRYVPQSRVMHLAGQSTGVTAPDRLTRRMPPYWFASRSRYFVKSHGLAYARLADFAFGIGLALWTLRCRLFRHPDHHPKGMLTDFWRTSVVFRRNAKVQRSLQETAYG